MLPALEERGRRDTQPPRERQDIFESDRLRTIFDERYIGLSEPRKAGKLPEEKASLLAKHLHARTEELVDVRSSRVHATAREAVAVIRRFLRDPSPPPSTRPFLLSDRCQSSVLAFCEQPPFVRIIRAMEKSTHTPLYDLFRARLVKMRKAAKLTQRQLAERLGREHSFVARIEIGDRRLDVVEFFWVCRACGHDALDVASELMKAFAKAEEKKST